MSNTSGVTRGQGTAYRSLTLSTLSTCDTRRVTLVTPTNNEVLRNSKQYLVVSGYNKSNTSGVTRGQGTTYRS
jgi:maleate cis-trans isomerase